MLTLESECSKCLGGRYCDGTVLHSVTGLSAAGYWCYESCGSREPIDDTQSPKRYGPCPPGGYYCLEGSSQPRNCPPGRYAPGNKFKLTAETDCDLCEAGQYCAAGNQSTTSGNCDPGYYCNKGSPTKAPTNTTHGGICPPGTYCPSGSPRPIPCVGGTYNNRSGQASCTPCPQGYYCPENSTYPLDCPSGYWCEGSASRADTNACPAGTFNNLTRRYSRSHCVDCTPGYYCDRAGTLSSSKL